MNLLRFRMTMEDYPEVMRVIEVPDTKTFEDLHHAILQSVNFDSTQLASFYVCNDEWEKKIEITLIDMQADEGDMTPVMKETELDDYLEEVGQKLVYEYDFVLMWKFILELEGVSPYTGPEDVAPPKVVESEGEAPAQYDAIDRYPAEITDEDDALINALKAKNAGLFHAGEDDGLLGDEEDDLFLDGDGLEDDEDHFDSGTHKEDDWY